jgi:hypothetical protein
MFKILPAALLASAVFLLPAQAQVRAGSFTGISSGGIHNTARGHSAMRRFFPPLLLGDPYDYADYTSRPAESGNAPQIIVVQVPAAAPPAPSREARVEPLMLELQGDHYVRVGEAQQEENQPAAQPRDARLTRVKPLPTANHANQRQSPAADLQPIALVYRDGHREQVRDYTIAGGALYASGNYWTDGYWSRKIQLSALNLPATEQANRADGAEFLLPRSPYEVVVRP